MNILFESSILANNSLIVRGGVGEEEDGLTCTSEYYDCCSSVNTSFGWFSPTGDAVYEGADGATDLYVTRGTGFVRLNRITGGTSALYWCDVPDYTGTVQRYYVGLYTDSILSGVSNIHACMHACMHTCTCTCSYLNISYIHVQLIGIHIPDLL